MILVSQQTVVEFSFAVEQSEKKAQPISAEGSGKQ